MGWHSDQGLDETPDPEAPNHTVRVTYNIPLTDWTADNGAMELLPGSHRQPWSFTSHNAAGIAHLWPVRPDLRVGDALVRDGHCLHRGTPNLTDEPRPMLDQTYRTAKAPRPASAAPS
jgi:ectoine hydroxylase-related dioxygenase (phytanoyl-CoA dioxygenase family)